jgi:phospholipase/carboxylesterase
VPALEDLAHALRRPPGTPAGALILLHGPGASEQDPIPLLELFDAERRLVCACPRGTLQLPQGIGYRWFVDREPGYPQRDTFEGSLILLGGWLDALWRVSGIAPERTVVGGFGQGAVMAWALAFAEGRPRLGGLLAVGGYIPRVTDLDYDESLLADLPVAICHGTRDPTVPVSFAESARDRAGAAGAEVLYRATDVPNILDPRVVGDVTDWIAGRFAA